MSNSKVARKRQSSMGPRSGRRMSSVGGIKLPKLQSHELLQPCCSVDKNNPAIGSLVFGKSVGFAYWPAIVIPLKEPTDSDDEAYKNENTEDFVLVMYLEETFRVSLITWSKVIRADVSRIDEQLDLIIALNKSGKKWSPNPAFKKSSEILKEFVGIEPMSRQDAAEEMHKKAKEEKRRLFQLKRESKLSTESQSNRSRTPSSNAELNIPKPPPPPRTSNVYSFRPAIVPSTHIRSLSADARPRNSTFDTEDDNSSTSDVPTKSVRKPYRYDRPKEGEPLRNWVKEMFNSLNKRFQFESNPTLTCASCKEVISTKVTFCHDLPFHSKCLTATTVMEDGVNKVVHKCLDCKNEACFICKSTEHKDQDLITKCKKCDLRFHRICLKPWPQAEIIGRNGTLTCPLHVCHTCKPEHRLLSKMRNYNVTKYSAYRCLYCLSAYHKGSCLPAGVGGSMMGNQFLVCPRHYGKVQEGHKAQKRVKILGCFACNNKIKSTEPKLECTGCPYAYHLKCGGFGQEEIDKGESLETYAADFKCVGCNWGIFPVHGQVVLYQQPRSSYWPALVSFPMACAARDVTKTGLSSVMYCGSMGQNFDQARLFLSLPFNGDNVDFLTKLDLYRPDKPQLVTAFEEARYLTEIAKAYRESILPKAEPIYKKLERNLYRTPASQLLKAKSKRPNRNDFDGTCECHQKTEDEVCTIESGCFNREMNFECNDKNCNSRLRCQNRMFTEKRGSIEDQLEYFDTHGRGWGAKTKILIQKDSFLIEYVGEVISKEEKNWRVTQKAEEDPRYFLEIDTNTYIDAEYYGNLSRFINHSCSPNCETAIYISAQGRPVAGIFAIRDIQPGEELTFDYNYGQTSQICLNCECGSAECKKYIGDRFQSTFGLLEAGFFNCSTIEKDWFNWDENCSVCKSGGNLLMCEHNGCKKVYHSKCLGIKNIPKGTWVCPDHDSSSRKKLTAKRNRGKAGKEKSDHTTLTVTKVKTATTVEPPHISPRKRRSNILKGLESNFPKFNVSVTSPRRKKGTTVNPQLENETTTTTSESGKQPDSDSDSVVLSHSKKSRRANGSLSKVRSTAGRRREKSNILKPLQPGSDAGVITLF